MYGNNYPQAQFQPQYGMQDGLGGMGGKRKFEGGNDNSQFKRSQFNEFENGANENKVTEVTTCPGLLVGKLIGRQGETINIIQNYSTCKVQVAHKEEGDPKKVSIMGTPENIQKVKEIINDVIYHDRNIMDEKRELECPQDIVGKIIGKSGETIKALILNSDAKIHVKQDMAEGLPRQIQISGRLDNVEIAQKMVLDILYGQNQTVQSIVQRYAKTINVKEQCSKNVVGKIIGKNGANIKILIKKTMAKIQIEQSTDPCIIDITGTEKSVNQALKDLREIIAGLQGGGQYGDGYGMAQGYQQNYGQGYGNMGGVMNPYQSQGMAQSQGQNPYGNQYGNYYNQGGANAASGAQYGAGGYGASGVDPAAAYGAMGYGGNSQANGAGAAGDWQELKDQQGRSYFYNKATNFSQWEKPAELM